jgi:hypothetical protein
MNLAALKQALATNSFSSEEERAQNLQSLIKKFTDLSRVELLEFQNHWDGNKSFEEFREAQDKVFLKCIDLEQSDLGQTVREATGLNEKLTDDLELV